MTSITYTAKREIHSDHIQSDLVNNGDFASGSTGWTATGWTVGTSATHNTGNTSSLTQAISGVSYGTSTTYEIAFTVSAMTAGTLTTYAGTTAGTAITENSSVYETLIWAGNNNLLLTPSTDFDGTVDDVVITITSSLSLDINASSLSEQWDIFNDEATSLDGTDEIIHHHQDGLWTYTSGLISTANLTDNYWYEFIASVYSGEVFLFDPFGTVASPDDPFPVVLVNHSFNREGNTDYHRVTFTMREV